ncbi:hypothetical protein SteCoe_34307 [Stentor coeruleus]|uniref:Methyltransferase type 11 domain-containing protein n=1 Tax=Stentor coeruleus TaxID=5963 RepID=A0A1R2AV09_9CILI|nr:hypothetical protein SteCoe_34307 [Stentor coeruleus]
MLRILSRAISAAPSTTSEEATRKFWNSMSEFYTKHHLQISNKNYQAMAPFLSLSTASSLLDAGCGIGNGYPIFAKHAGKALKVSMIDISDENVSKAKAIYGDKADIRRSNAESLPFKPNQFDAYVANGLLEIADNPDWVIAEAFRTLKSGGHAAFSLYGRMGICNVLRIYKRIANSLRLERGTFSAKFELSEPEKVKAMVKNAGFGQCLSFYEQYHYPQLTVDELISIFLDNPLLQEEAKTLGKTKQLESVIREELFNIIEVKEEPLIFESLVIVAAKP